MTKQRDCKLSENLGEGVERIGLKGRSAGLLRYLPFSGMKQLCFQKKWVGKIQLSSEF